MHLLRWVLFRRIGCGAMAGVEPFCTEQGLTESFGGTMSQYSLEASLGRHGAAADLRPAPRTRAHLHVAAPRPVSLFDATGGAKPVHVARRPLTLVRTFAAVTVLAAAMAGFTSGEHWTPLVSAIVAATGVVATALAWAWARRPQVILGHRGIWFAATADRPEVVHPWSEVLAVYGETGVEKTHPGQVHGREQHVLGVHLRRASEVEARVVRRSAVDPLLRLHRVVVSVAPSVPVTRQEPWGPQPGQHPLVVLWRKLARGA